MSPHPMGNKWYSKPMIPHFTRAVHDHHDIVLMIRQNVCKPWNDKYFTGRYGFCYVVIIKLSPIYHLKLTVSISPAPNLSFLWLLLWDTELPGATRHVPLSYKWELLPAGQDKEGDMSIIYNNFHHVSLFVEDMSVLWQKSSCKS